MEPATASNQSTPPPLSPSEKLGEGKAPAPGLDVEARVPEFQELIPGGRAAAGNPLDLLLDVAVTMTAELGKIKLSIADVLRLGIGSVVQLDRLIGEPVELMVQGKCVARGEVVVVDGRFGVQIKEITDPRKRA